MVGNNFVHIMLFLHGSNLPRGQALFLYFLHSFIIYQWVVLLFSILVSSPFWPLKFSILRPITPNMKRTIIFCPKYLNISMYEGRNFTLLAAILCDSLTDFGGPIKQKSRPQPRLELFWCSYYSQLSHRSHRNRVALNFKINSNVVIWQDKVILVIFCISELGEYDIVYISILVMGIVQHCECKMSAWKYLEFLQRARDRPPPPQNNFSNFIL